MKWSISHGSGIPRNVRLLGWASCLNDIASEMIYPLLPMFLTSVLHGSRFYLGVIEGLGESVASLLKLWAGTRSDRSGQRKVFVVGGYAVSAVARPLSAVATIPAHLFGLRMIDRVGKGTRTAPRDAMIADSTLPALRGRAFGFHRAMDHLGAAAGPLLAAALLTMWPDRLRLVFGLTLVPGAGALPASVLFGAIYDAWGPTQAFSVGATLAGVAIGILFTVPLGNGGSVPCAEPDRDVP